MAGRHFFYRSKLMTKSPGTGSWAMAVLFPLWFIAHCISRLTHLPVIRLTVGTGYYYFSLIVKERYSIGVTPNFRLKTRLKYEILLNPDSRAMLVTERFVSASWREAISSRY